MERGGTENSGAFPVAPGRQMKGFVCLVGWLFVQLFNHLTRNNFRFFVLFSLLLVFTFFFGCVGKEEKDKVVCSLYCSRALSDQINQTCVIVSLLVDFSAVGVNKSKLLG